MKILLKNLQIFSNRSFGVPGKGIKSGNGWRFWAVAHSAGYKSRFCEICRKELETTRKETTFRER